jgi:biotin transport system substrate-specific component
MSIKPGISFLPSESRIHPLLADAIIVFAASLFVAICAHIAIPLWFTPVPLTFQTFAVLLIGLTLGSRKGLAALVLYLAEGAAGLPVFNPHGPGGVFQLLGPTGGYLMSYPFAAFLAGYATERRHSAEGRFAPALDIIFGALTAELVIFAGGALWFWTLTHYTAKTILAMSVFPFFPGEAIKVAVAAALALQWRRFRKN